MFSSDPSAIEYGVGTDGTLAENSSSNSPFIITKYPDPHPHPHPYPDPHPHIHTHTHTGIGARAASAAHTAGGSTIMAGS